MSILQKIFRASEDKPAVVQRVEPTLSVAQAMRPLGMNRQEVIAKVNKTNFQRMPVAPVGAEGGAMDAANPTIAANFAVAENTAVNTVLLAYFGSNGFPGWPFLAMVASQNSLIDKACGMPASDAIHNGYEVVVDAGLNVSPETIEQIKQEDEAYKIHFHAENFVKMTRVFGLRIAMFVVDVVDKIDYYKKPFNIDGVPEGSYRGIVQLDPNWVSPVFDISSATPGSMDFYEPTWWSVNGMMVHRTHLIVGRCGTLPDILKPTYWYGSVSVTQKIMQRVYAAEQTANEAPKLAMTKRTGVINMDITKAMADYADTKARFDLWTEIRDNYAAIVLDDGESFTQSDTSLADLDAVIMTQYQLVAAIAEVPAVKLLGTSPKGFGASGEYEEKSYHQMLEGLQNSLMRPLIQRHHELLIKSKISPKAPFDTAIKFNPLDSPTAEQQAAINKIKAETAKIHFDTGAIDGFDERERIAKDPESGYDNLTLDRPEERTDEDDPLGIGAILGLNDTPTSVPSNPLEPNAEPADA